ncbi:hypothetical protein [Gimesia sp.]|uniref:hypothetical protein n=1 Tax=Gimesia sp. TaxID=2024833 RepID=UPI0032EF343C
MKELWMTFVAVVAFPFLVLEWIGTRIYQEMPPIPEKIEMTDGQTLFGSGEITSRAKRAVEASQSQEWRNPNRPSLITKLEK